jgi:hypothetical protein
MAISAQELNIILTARDKQFQKAMTAAEKKVQRFSNNSQKNLSNTSKSFALLGSAAKRFLPALAAGAVVAAVKKVTSSMDEIGKKADAIGIGTDALQELRAAAVSAGVSQNGLDKSLEQFSKRLGEAVQGTGTAKVALEQMGLSADDLAQMPLDKALGVFADKFALVEDATARTALATQVFGREGFAMTNVLKGGSAALDESRKKMRDMGVVIDEDLIRNAEKMQDRFDAASTVIGAQFSIILGNLAPILIAAAEGAAYLAKAVADLIKFVDSFTDGEDAVDDAVRAVVVSMAAEIHQSKLLEAQLARGGKMSVDIARKKHKEALARLEAAKASMAEAKADRLNSDAYKDLTARIAKRQAMLTESPEEAANRARRLRAADLSGKGDGTAAAAAQLASAKLQLIELNKQRDALLDSSGFQGLDQQITRASANVEKLAAALAKAKNGNISLGPSITPIALDPKGAAEAAEERKAALLAGNLKVLQNYTDALIAAEKASADMSAEELSRLESVRSAYDGVRGSLDPLYAATQQYAEAIQEVNAALAEGFISEEQAAKDREGLLRVFETAKAEASELSAVMETVSESFATAFGDIISGTSTVEGAFRKMAGTILTELFRIQSQQMMSGGGGGSLLGSLLSGLGSVFGGGGGDIPGLASGGPMAAGSPAVVGEHGREIFVPSSPGRILSVPQSKAAVNGGGGTTVNQTINVTTGIQQTVRAEIQSLMPQIAAASTKAVLDARRRGGSFAGAFS